MNKYRLPKIFLKIFSIFSKTLKILIGIKKIKKILIYYEEFLFCPFSLFSIICAIFNLIFIALIFIKIPLDLSFDLNIFYQKNYFLLEKIILIFFIFDILVKLNTGIYFKGNLITDRRVIFKKYVAKGKFFRDFLSLLGLIFKLINYNSLFKEYDFKLFYCFFILRLKNFNENLKILEDAYPGKMRNFFSALKLIIFTLFSSHIFSCIWYSVANMQLGNVHTWLDERNLVDQIWWKKYLSAYYYVCVTMNTVGYGDIVPKNEIETIYSIFFIYFACGMFGYTINCIVNIFQDLNKEKKEFEKNLSFLNAYLKKKNVNGELSTRIRNYFEYAWKEEVNENKEEEKKILEKLSQNLKEEILFEGHKYILNKMPFLTENFSEDFQRKLICVIDENRYIPNEIIYLKGDYEDLRIYFIVKGEIEIFLETRGEDNNYFTTINKLEKNNAFGEISFFSDSPHGSCAKSSNFSTLYSIKIKDFLNIIKLYPSDHEKYCEIRDNIRINKNFSILSVKCLSCKENSHFIYNCPYLNFKPFKDILIKKFTHNYEQKRKKNLRINKTKHNALKNMKKMNKLFLKEKDNEYREFSESVPKQYHDLKLLSSKKGKTKVKEILIKKKEENFIKIDNFDVLKNFVNYFPNDNSYHIIKRVNFRNQYVFNDKFSQNSLIFFKNYSRRERIKKFERKKNFILNSNSKYKLLSINPKTIENEKWKKFVNEMRIENLLKLIEIIKFSVKLQKR